MGCRSLNVRARPVGPARPIPAVWRVRQRRGGEFEIAYNAGLAGDADDLADGFGPGEYGEHEVGDVGARDRPAAAHILPGRGPVVRGERFVGQLRSEERRV